MSDSLSTFSFLGLTALGIAVLIATSLVYGPVRQGSGDLLRRILVLTGSLLIFMGVGGVLLVLSVLSVALIIFAIGAAIEALILYRRTERQAVLAHIAIAIERGIPLDTAIRAYGLERFDTIGWHSQRVVDALTSGMPLPAALEHSGYRLATGQSLAVGLGWELGCVPTAVRQSLGTENQASFASRSAFEKLAYFCALITLISGVVTFMAIKLLPVYRKMFEEFGIELPWLTQVLVETTSQGSAAIGLLMLTSLLLLCGMLFLAVVGLTGWVRDIPLLGRVTLRSDGAWVLRGLSWGLARGQPITETLRQIELYFPKARVRRRLERARKMIQAGGDWTVCLQRTGLIRASDAGVLESAQRVGNLTWALEELAEGTFRRLGYRLRAMMQLVFPLIVIALGGLIGFIALGMMLPLFQLIEKLA